MRLLFWIAWAALIAIRLPSLVEPLGADQGLYAYVGSRMLAGDAPYRDVFDQKPPAIHAVYAIAYAIWPRDGVVAALDLAAAAAAAALMAPLARQLGVASGGPVAALILLAFGNPALGRLGGVRTRSQCETFIALAIVGAIVMAQRGAARRSQRDIAIAGLLVGAAILFKYTAVVYLVPAAWAWWAARGAATAPAFGARASVARHALVAAAACGAIVMLTGAVFAAAGALPDLFYDTVAYNTFYSGSTYAGPLDAISYAIDFPVQRARVDGLWFLGGLGCIGLLARWIRSRSAADLAAPVWVIAACVAIAINGRRGLPQYLVQAAPALALAAGLASAMAWRTLKPAGRAAAALLLAVALWRVVDFAKPVEYLRHDWRYLTGGMSERAFLDKFGAFGDEKFAPLAAHDLAAYLRDRTAAGDRVLVFGFSPAAYVWSGRASASRFAWSRPVVFGFREGDPRFGAQGLHADLLKTRPPYVALESRDEGMDEQDSASYFMRTPLLADWLTAEYERADRLEDFEIWRRKR